MSDPIVPDDLARSKSGRIPQWVLDEAKGIKTEPVPFRAAHTPSPGRTDGGSNGRGMRWLRLVLVVAIVGGIVAVIGRAGFGGGGQSAFSHEPKAARQGPPLGYEEKGHPLGTPQPVALPSTSYLFEELQADDRTPVRWSPCRPIHYVVRQANAPANGQRMIEDAIDRLETVTGFQFVNDGATDEAPRHDRRPYQKDRYGDRWAPVLFVWATPNEVPDFGVDIVGEATAQRIQSTSGDFVYVTGTVALDPRKLTQDTKRYGEAEARAIILHELGHLVGLEHVSDRGQIMFPRSRLGVTEYQPGDLAGLHELATGPCQKDI